ncbi:MAG: hypothetical protein WAQ41_06520 [bacterium]|nr:hypothetical protein [Bacillota bacterium]HHW55122.1 hypothetical protein [Bacillota bacterium]
MAQIQQVFPGTQCQIDCIRVEKIYDQCFQLEELPDTVAVDLGRALLPTDSISCEIIEAECEIMEPLRDPDPEGFRTIDVVQNVTVRVTVIDAAGNVVGSTTVEQPPHFKSVTLFAPEGTFPECEIVDTFCEPVLIVNPGSTTAAAQIRILKKLCKIIFVVATVNLLVPTFGFCQPEPCAAFPQQFVCPPENLFPPQRPGPV